MSQSDIVVAREATPIHMILEVGMRAVFGYGSLLSIASLESTLGRRYEASRVLCEVRGWRRTWDVAMPNNKYYAQCPEGPVRPKRVIYLNVRPDVSGSVNGILFVISADELAAYDRREWIYSRTRVNQGLIGVRVTGGDAWLYVGRPEYLFPAPLSWRDGGIRRTYLQMLAAAHGEFGDVFRDRFEASTQSVPEELIFEDRAEGR